MMAEAVRWPTLVGVLQSDECFVTVAVGVEQTVAMSDIDSGSAEGGVFHF